MRTRKSWRNQDRLWRELGGKKPESKIQPSRVCFNCRHYQSRRNRGKCDLHNIVVYGSQEKPCFQGGRIAQAFKELAKASNGAYDVDDIRDQHDAEYVQELHERRQASNA